MGLNRVIWIVGYYLLVNLFTFTLMGIDKQRAKKKVYRISEKTFILWSILGAGLGVKLATYYFRHKTTKKKFTVLPILFLLIHILFWIYVFFMQ